MIPRRAGARRRHPRGWCPAGGQRTPILLALVLCLRTLRAVMLAETAFTLSHTLSFSASSLGWIRVSSTAAEACIAVSLVLVALDVARVLQTPTSRWSVFDCQRAPNANPTDCAPGGKLNVQIAERAWTSPIWYLP